jgi:type IV pilus assembly protein PilQ
MRITSRLCFLGLVLAVAGTALWIPVAAGAEKPGEEEFMGPRKEIDIDVKEKPLAAVVDYIRTVTGENIVLGKNKDGKLIIESPEMRVTIKLEGVYWKTALRLVAEAARCQVEVIDEKVFKVFQPPVVTMVFENADVRIVVDQIARISGKNIVIGSDVGEGKRVTLRVANLPWMKALETVVKSVGLTVVVEEGPVYRIADPASLIKELVTEVIRLKYITLPGDYRAIIKNELVEGRPKVPSEDERLKQFTLRNALKEVISKDVGQLEYDKHSNSLLITDVATKIKEVKDIIKLIDVEPAMVMVDVKFVSTKRTDIFDVGFNWADGPKFGIDPNTGLGSFYTRLPFNLGRGGFEDQIGVSWPDPPDVTGTFRRGPTSADVIDFFSLAGESPYTFGKITFDKFHAMLGFLKNDKLTQITQRPTLGILDNTTGTIFVGESVRYAELQVQQTQAGGTQAQISEGENSPVDVGFQLLVKPHVILEAGKIMMTVIPTMRDLAGTSSPLPGFDRFAVGDQYIDLPRIAASTVVTNMILEDGETAVIGGLVHEFKNEQINKWPILGDIPLIGYLFKNVYRLREKRNIIIFITTSIMRDSKTTKAALKAQLDSRARALEEEYYKSLRHKHYTLPEPEKTLPPGKTTEPGKKFRNFFEDWDEAKDGAPDEDSESPSRRRDRVRKW